jgi:hypothetical protein
MVDIKSYLQLYYTLFGVEFARLSELFPN